MPYVQRDEIGNIVGVFENRQPGLAEEWLDAESGDLVMPKSQAIINAEARAYLASTDWYVIRSQETGDPVPEEILVKRAKRRAEVV